MQNLIICRCEEVSLKDLKETMKKYNCSARELKLRTRAGMGFCGGRTCRTAVDKILTSITNDNPPDTIPLKIAPPVRPLTLYKLGGMNYYDKN